MTAPESILRGRNPDDLDSSERRELVSAYLDDELSAEEARIVTHWLDEHPGALREVEHLRRTWDLLDHYTDEPVPEGFTSRVLAEAGVSRSTGSGQVVKLQWYRRPLGIAAAVLLAFGAAFVAMDDKEHPTPPEAISAAQMLDTVPDELVEHMDLLADLTSDDFEASLIDYEDFDTEGQGG